MNVDETPELLLLHALPLDGTMWADQMALLPGATYAPTLYPFGDRIQAWAAKALALAKGNRVIVVGSSVGGSCALEVAALAPDRVAALVLIGTKANRRPDPALLASALQTIDAKGMEAAWHDMWEPLFSHKTSPSTIRDARQIALRQTPEAVSRGVTVFHTRPDREAVLSGFSGPVIVVTGSQDIAPGLKTSEKQARLAQHGSLHVIPDCGHYVAMERPDALNAILRDTIAAIV